MAEGEPAAGDGRAAADVAGDLATEILEGEGPLPEDCPLLLGRPAALLSGGLIGMDALFGEAAANAGHLVAHWLAPSTRASRRARELNGGRSLCQLGPEALNHSAVTASLDLCARFRAGAESFEELCRRDPGYEGRREDLQRSYFQVARASAVYVVAHRPLKAEDAGQPPLDLGGNLGWAAQMYVDRFKPVGEEEAQFCQLFLYDNSDEGNGEHCHDPTTMGRWSYWQAPNGRNGLLEGRWIPFGTDVPVLQRSHGAAWKTAPMPPQPTGFYAGIGSTSLGAGSGHEEALATLYEPRPEGQAPKAPRSGGKGGRKGEGKGRGRGSAAAASEEVDV